MVKKREINILLAEDNPQDVEITQEAFERGKLSNKMFVVKDGKEALDFLFHEGQYQDAAAYPTPDLILLDIKMPKVDGLEVLERIKQDNELKRLPVIVLTVSDREADVIKAYNSGVNSYIVKPVRFSEFLELVSRVKEYWITITKLPPHDEIKG